MDMKQALTAFGALSQQTRLEVFQMLVRAGPDGMLAGEIGEALGVKQNTMSANLSVLLNAGLARNERQGRTVRYFADYEASRALIRFMMRDCCGGIDEVCGEIVAEFSCPQTDGGEAAPR